MAQQGNPVTATNRVSRLMVRMLFPDVTGNGTSSSTTATRKLGVSPRVATRGFSSSRSNGLPSADLGGRFFIISIAVLSMPLSSVSSLCSLCPLRLIRLPKSCRRKNRARDAPAALRCDAGLRNGGRTWPNPGPGAAGRIEFPGMKVNRGRPANRIDGTEAVSSEPVRVKPKIAAAADW